MHVMKNTYLNLIFILTFLFITSLSHSQVTKTEIKKLDSTKIKHINIGLKLGIPNLIGGSAEIILPVLGNRIGPYIDYSGFNIDSNEVGTSLSYLEYGANLYFNQKGSGFFISLGQAKFNSDLTFYDLSFTNGGMSSNGSVSTEFNFNTTNLKLGIKTSGTLYFRFEVGFGFGDIPDSIDFTATLDGITESFSEEIPPIPGLGQSGILIGNIGFGVAF